MIPYVLSGRPTAFWRGDWYVGKGIAHARIRAHFPPRARNPPKTRAQQDSNSVPPRAHGNDNPREDGGEQEEEEEEEKEDDDDDDSSLTIEVFNTHTHAPYSSDKSDTYRVHREAQAWALAKLLRSAAEKRGNHLVIAAGDLNTTPLSTAHRIITAHAPVRDVWRVLHPDSSLGSWAEDRQRGANGGENDEHDDGDHDIAPTAEFNLVENGVTSNSVLNTWRWSKSEQSKLGNKKEESPHHHHLPSVVIDPCVTPDPRGKRLDYIFANTAAHQLPSDQNGVGGWVVKDARVTMTTRHPDLECSLSDHFAVAATLVYHRTSNQGTGASQTGIDVASLAGQHWPLPPGRGSLFQRHHQHEHNKRKSTPALLLQGSHDDDKTNANPNNNIQEEDPAATTAPGAQGHDDARSPRGGAFLSLQSPTPSTSRLSLPGTFAPLVADYDTQLLSSLSASPSGDVAGFDVHDYDALLSSLRAYVAREADQTRWRTYHFAFWLCITIICYIVVWVVPTHTSNLSGDQVHAINFILLLLSSLGLVAGVLDGLMALLFFRGSEKRALNEFQWELSNARAFALGETPGFTEATRTAKY